MKNDFSENAVKTNFSRPDPYRSPPIVPSVAPLTMFADRVVGKPYLEIIIDREAITRYGIQLGKVQEVLVLVAWGRAVLSV